MKPLGYEFEAPWRHTHELLREMGLEMPSGEVLNVGAGGPQGQHKVNVAFPKRKIVHTDIEKFKGIERIADVESLPFEDSVFAGVVCVAVLEHVGHPWKAVPEMARVLIPGGLSLIISPWMWRKHMGADYWRFMEGAYALLAEGTDLVVVCTGVYRPMIRKGREDGPWIDTWAVLRRYVVSGS